METSQREVLVVDGECKAQQRRTLPLTQTNTWKSNRGRGDDQLPNLGKREDPKPCANKLGPPGRDAGGQVVLNAPITKTSFLRKTAIRPVRHIKGPGQGRNK